MTHPAINHAVQVEEFCSTRELSGFVGAEVFAQPNEIAFRDEGILRMRLIPADPAQMTAARRIEAGLNYMLKHLNKPFKVPAISSLVGLSESSFYALFKKATGLTPLDFFIRARMQVASELLADTMLQIKEVAVRVGYDDQFYFSRLFKAVKGVSPRAYRKLRQAGRQIHTGAFSVPNGSIGMVTMAPGNEFFQTTRSLTL